MSDETPEVSAESLLHVGEEIRRKRGRPPGSKNKPKDGTETLKVNEKNQVRIFAGAIRALFMLLAVLLAWFGYEQYKELEEEELERGATYLLPISHKVGLIASIATYLSFPIWLLTALNSSFRKKTNQVEAPAVSNAGNGNGASPDSPPVSTEGGSPAANGSPQEENTGFSPLPTQAN